MKDKNKDTMKNKFYHVGEVVWWHEYKKPMFFQEMKDNEFAYLSHLPNAPIGAYEVVHVKNFDEYRPHKKKRSLTGLDHAFAQVREFHEMMGQPVAKFPTPMSKDRALFRMIMTNEELVEFLYATVKGDIVQFDELVDKLIEGTNAARNKMKDKADTIDDVLTAQVDASTDAKYLMLGTDVELGVFPQEAQDIVHCANLGKRFPDGKAHFNEQGKVIKPENWEQDYAPENKIRMAIQGQIERAQKRNRIKKENN